MFVCFALLVFLLLFSFCLEGSYNNNNNNNHHHHHHLVCLEHYSAKISEGGG
jgi:Fe2+ or Zn2+ uptake regulation protein